MNSLYYREDNMFYTKKERNKNLFYTVFFFALGLFCLFLASYTSDIKVFSTIIFIVFVICCFYVFFLILFGKYADSEAKYISRWTTFIRNELRPAECIKEYESLRNTPGLLVNQPTVNVLYLLAIAYSIIDEREKCLATIEEMVAVAPTKKKMYANLIKASFLFSNGNIDEAEAIINDTKTKKLDIMSATILDNILKSDRPKAMGDYKAVELYALRGLERKFPKLDNLSLLILHYELAEAYDKMQNLENAITHYQYCVSNGGETAMRVNAKARIESLQNK